MPISAPPDGSIENSLQVDPVVGREIEWDGLSGSGGTLPALCQVMDAPLFLFFATGRCSTLTAPLAP